MQLQPGELYQVQSTAIDELERKYGSFTATTGTPLSIDPMFHTESRFIYCFDKGIVEAYTQ